MSTTESLPHNAQISSGVLRLAGQTIFLKNVTSTRIKREVGVREYKWYLGVLAGLMVFGAVPIGMFTHWVVACVGVVLSVAAALATSKRPSWFVLLIVTAAGENKLVSDTQASPLKQIEEAIAVEIAAL